MQKYIVMGVISVLSLLSVHAGAQEKDKLTVAPTGRILMDAGLFDSDNKSFANGVAVPDLRVGVKASYGKYKAKLDIGYSYGKVSLKDVFVERQFSSSSLLRVGHFVHQFGLQSSTSSSMKITMEEPASNEAFFNSRLIGAMYVHDKDNFFATGSAFVENEAMKKSSDQMGKQGYGFMSRLVYRPLRKPGAIFHVGLSGAFEKARYNSDEELNHKSFILSSRFPSRIAKVTAVEAVITDARHLFKFTPEILANYGPVALESQYYYVNVNRKETPNYKASGAYATLRGLILGGDYRYSNSDSGISTPMPGSLEAVASYNYTDMSDGKAQIYGGRLNDVALGFNYYINKYMIWRFRYSYTHVSHRAEIENQSVHAFQTRFQVIF